MLLWCGDERGAVGRGRSSAETITGRALLRRSDLLPFVLCVSWLLRGQCVHPRLTLDLGEWPSELQTGVAGGTCAPTHIHLSSRHRSSGTVGGPVGQCLCPTPNTVRIVQALRVSSTSDLRIAWCSRCNALSTAGGEQNDSIEAGNLLCGPTCQGLFGPHGMTLLARSTRSTSREPVDMLVGVFQRLVITLPLFTLQTNIIDVPLCIRLKLTMSLQTDTVPADPLSLASERPPIPSSIQSAPAAPTAAPMTAPTAPAVRAPMTVPTPASKPTTSSATRDAKIPQTEQLQIIDETQHFTYVTLLQPSCLHVGRSLTAGRHCPNPSPSGT